MIPLPKPKALSPIVPIQKKLAPIVPTQKASTQKVKPLRPEGKFGVEITIAIDGALRTLWLSGIDSLDNDIFRTPPDVRLGLPIGQMVEQLLEDLSLKEDLFPNIDLGGITVDRLELRRSKASTTQSFTFGLEISIPYGEAQLRIWLMLNNSEQTLQLRLGDLNDPTTLAVSLAETGLFLHFQQSSNPKSFNLASVGRVVSSDLEQLMGAIEINPAEMVIGSHKASGSYVLAFRLSQEITLSQLPFVGEKIPQEADVGINNLGLVWCSSAVVNNPDAQTYFTDTYKSKRTQADTSTQLITAESLASGGLFSAELKLPFPSDEVDRQQLSLPFASPDPSSSASNPIQSSPAPAPAPTPSTSGQTQSSPAPSPTPKQASSAGLSKWFDVNKTVGPLSLKRLGLQYADKKVWFLFDSSLSAGAATLILDGLGAGIDPFELLGGRFDPSFTLRGLGLEIKGPAEVSGAFLREEIQDPRGNYDEFSGVVLIKTDTFNLSGMGSYADPSWGSPSLFAYAFLDKPIGGPAFFFVTGLALGIAINRNLDLPPIDQVSQFPLVRLALGESLTPPGTTLPAVRNTNGDAELAELLKVQEAMKPYTRPQDGQMALAIGVRFTTFKLLNSFALLVASFGKQFKLDMLVSSRLQVPPLPEGASTSSSLVLAKVGIDLRGTWIPETGFLIIEGRITEGSWFLDQNCRLSGGAAFASWNSGPHDGDFVMTVGGYHPKFPIPAHYPNVPRIAFNYTRDPITIKGDAYFAMTPSALMAGGSLSATYQSGNKKAWFDCTADFLVAWDPFSYEATMSVEVGASYTFSKWGLSKTVRASIGADLHLWGPDLAGKASIRLKVVTIDIRFGPSKKHPEALKASEFRNRFLPNQADLISINVSTGLMRSGVEKSETDDTDIPVFVVNPAGFVLAIESAIPKPDDLIGIGPMGKTNLETTDLETTSFLDYKITKSEADVSDSFSKQEIQKPLPAALWEPASTEGTVRLPSLKANNTVIDAVVGYTIKPKDEPKAEGSKEYEISLLDTNNDSWKKSTPKFFQNHYQFTELANEIDAVKNSFQTMGNNQSSGGNNTPDLFTALSGQDATSKISLSTEWLDNLQELPRVGTLTST